MRKYIHIHIYLCRSLSCTLSSSAFCPGLLRDGITFHEQGRNPVDIPRPIGSRRRSFISHSGCGDGDVIRLVYCHTIGLLTQRLMYSAKAANAFCHHSICFSSPSQPYNDPKKHSSKMREKRVGKILHIKPSNLNKSTNNHPHSLSLSFANPTNFPDNS
jgi:hypothetical protein